jgi:hypothetical protein
MAGECVFCRRDLTSIAGEEHIFPQWLLKHLGIPKTDQMFQGVGATATLDCGEAAEKRRHGTWRFVEGRTCKPCNEGWLDKLERDTKPGLEILIKQGGRIVALTAVQRELLARWAAKTAFLIANVSPFKHPVPPGHLWAMNDGADVPPGVAVFAGQSGTTTNTAYLQSTQWPQFSARRAGYLVGSMNNAYKIGLQIRDLMLLVAFVPRSGVQFATAAGVHLPLNPLTPIWPCYLAPLPEDPQPPLWIFTRSLAAVVT